MSARKILLVDDDAGVNYLNRFLLESAGIGAEIQVAQNGQEALDILEKDGVCPDVIFLDVNMPVMDGFEFLQELKQRTALYNTARIYVITSSLRETDRETALSFECVKGYLEKPLSEEMINKIFAVS
ncbi:MAG TPA: response regulator [Chitinophagales bacterium]|nr:response regulator [Chitinophagales bacterium]